MFRSDAQQKEEPRDEPLHEVNINKINVEVVSEIEKELQDSSYDIISLVFLLYDVPETALQRLIVYQRVAGNPEASNINLLQDWAHQAKSKSTWKHEFLEALLICQLYGIVQKLGLDLPSVKKYYQPENWHFKINIDPMKKALYKVCENINMENLTRLKNTLQNFKIDVKEFDSCELIFLKLMSEKFITMTQVRYDKKVLSCEFNVSKLTNILEKLPGLDKFAKDLRALQNSSLEPTLEEPMAASSPKSATSDTSAPAKTTMKINDFTDVFEILEDLNIEDEYHLKSDNKKMNRDKYVIKNKERVGICIIINQEEFSLSERSILDDTLTTVLDKRDGSNADRIELEKTMSSLNFKVVVGNNLNHEAMIDFIKDCLRDKVKSTDSILMLCILSHGVRGHVYAADCVKVSVESIQGILDSEEAHMLRGIPKVLIIQACQIDDTPQTTLVADSPLKNLNNYSLKGSDFLVFWATAPQYKAFRDVKSGSVFIQLLCMILQKRGRKEQLYDIFTTVNRGVQEICRRRKCKQVPIFETTLRKKIFLQIPE